MAPVARVVDFMREDVQQDLGIGVRVDVPAILEEQRLAKLVGVHEVAVVAEHDAEGGVHVERLRLRDR